MSDKTKNNEGPVCACGRVDIYKEMLKAKKANNDDSAASGQVENDESSDSEESKEDKRKTEA